MLLFKLEKKNHNALLNFCVRTTTVWMVDISR